MTRSTRTRLAVLCASIAPIGAFAGREPAGAIDPAPAKPAQQIGLSSLSVNPTSVVGGNGSTGMLTLTSTAPSGGLVASLSSSNPSAATVPANVTIASSTNSRTFTIMTGPVTTETRVTITAALGSTTLTATLDVTPAAGAASLSSIKLTPSTVTGGDSAVGTATLGGPAPGGGVLVTLSSSTPSVARVPASVTVQPGRISANFSVSTSAVSTSTPVTIKGFGGGTTRTATLTAKPVGADALPAPELVAPEHDARFGSGQHIAFDWNDVTGAASYLLQIDELEAFPAPFVQETTSASQFGTGTLPVRTSWWRVCAFDAAGNPGAWSSVRRFEVKD